MIIGELAVNWVILLYIPAVFLVPCYTYYMAARYHEEPPFPHATVTSTACHYPQDIVMRLVMGTASSVLALIFYIVYRWTVIQAKRTGFRQYSKYLFYLT